MARSPWTVIKEMVGKVDDNRWLDTFSMGIQRIFKNNDLTVDYAKNDYDLFRSIYHASKVNKTGAEYMLAAALGKPIINITTGFVVGKGFKIELDNPDRDKGITEAEDKINEWLEENMADLYDVIKFHFRDGDGYVYIDELGAIDILDATTVTVQLDPVSGKVVGFDVKEVVDEKNALTGQKVTYIYLKQYRFDSIRIIKYRDSETQEQAIVVFQRVYREEEDNELSDLIQRRLPIIHFVNEPEARQVYGNSEFQNLLTLFRHYSEVLKSSTKGVIYNNTPVPVLKGVTDPKKLAEATKDPNNTSSDSGTRQEWDQNSIIYLTGDHADAKFLQVSGMMDDVSKLLEIYFYLFVQGSETPEFAFGTAVSSSHASTDSQMPILVKKVERKQRRLTTIIQDLVKLYIEKQALLSDPVYLNIWQNEPKVRVNFPKVDEDDKQLTFDTVVWAYESNLLTAKTALEMIAGDAVKDVAQEIKDAAKEADAAAKKNAQFDADRMLKELLATNNPDNPNNPTPPANNAPNPANSGGSA